jgi:hypothetical protein
LVSFVGQQRKVDCQGRQIKKDWANKKESLATKPGSPKTVSLKKLELPGATTLVVVAASAVSTAETTTITTASATKSTASAAVAATTAETTTTTGRALFARTSFVYGQSATIELFTIPELNCSLSCFLSVHLDKTETTRAAGHFVYDYLSGCDVTSLSKCLLESVVGCAVRQVSDI